MAPSDDTIREIFSKIGPDGGELKNWADPSIDLHVMGHEHSTKRSHKSTESMANDFFGQFEFVDWETVKIEVTRVIGGYQSPWAAVEMVSKGKSKKNKPINHEFVFIVHFNGAGKIDTIRAYLDSDHLENHFQHHSKS